MATQKALKERDEAIVRATEVRKLLSYQLCAQQDALSSVPTRQMWRQVNQLWRENSINNSTVFKQTGLSKISLPVAKIPPTTVSFSVVTVQRHLFGLVSQQPLPYADLLTTVNWLRFFQQNFTAENWQGEPNKYQPGLCLPDDQTLLNHSLVTGIYQAISYGKKGVQYFHNNSRREGSTKTAYGINRFIGIACVGPVAELSLWIGLAEEYASQRPDNLIGSNPFTKALTLAHQQYLLRPNITVPLTTLSQNEIAETIASSIFRQEDIVISQRVVTWQNDNDQE